MGLLFRWVVLALAILATPYLVNGVTVDSLGAALAGAAVLVFFNFLLKPLLLLLTFPLTVFTLGLFIFVINGLLFYWVSSFVGGIHVISFWAAFWAALWVSIISWATNLSIDRKSGGPRVVIHGTDGQRRMRDLN